MACCRESVTVNDQLSQLLWDCSAAFLPVDPHLSLTMSHILIGSGLTLGNNARWHNLPSQSSSQVAAPELNFCVITIHNSLSKHDDVYHRKHLVCPSLFPISSSDLPSSSCPLDVPKTFQSFRLPLSLSTHLPTYMQPLLHLPVHFNLLYSFLQYVCWSPLCWILFEVWVLLFHYPPRWPIDDTHSFILYRLSLNGVAVGAAVCPTNGRRRLITYFLINGWSGHVPEKLTVRL